MGETHNRPAERVLPAILLVEGDPVAAAEVSRQLDDLQLANPLHTVFDVPDALEWLSASTRSGQAPAVVMVDTLLPGGEALDVLEWLRSRPVYRDVPVIVMASPDDGDGLRDDDWGVVWRLVKPSGIQYLGEVLHRLRAPWALLSPTEV